MGGEPVFYHWLLETWNTAGRSQKLINFFELYLCLSEENKKRKPREAWREPPFDLLSICLTWSFALTRCSFVTWVTQILMRAIFEGSLGLHFPTMSIRICLSLNLRYIWIGNFFPHFFRILEVLRCRHVNFEMLKVEVRAKTYLYLKKIQEINCFLWHLSQNCVTWKKFLAKGILHLNFPLKFMKHFFIQILG